MIKKFKRWLIDNFLPTYAKQEILKAYEKEKERNAELVREVERLNAYIDGLETGIKAHPDEFEFIGTDKDRNAFYDFYCLKRSTPLEQIKLLPGETDAVRWASLEEIHQLIERKQICRVIAAQFLKQEQLLIDRIEK